MIRACLVVLVIGCGSDPLPSPEDGGRDAGAPVTCAGMDDGMSCGVAPDLICLDQSCVTSRCGDGFPDTRLGEECDDANDTAFDGCDPDCTFTCESDVDCADGQACNGEETCADHVCVAGTMLDDGTACTTALDTAGVCVGGGCSDAAPAVTINHPGDGETRQAGVSIPWVGAAMDNEGTPLTGTQLVWTSDLEGAFGEGTSFDAALAMVGTHQITLSATDSAGNVGTATITLTLVP